LELYLVPAYYNKQARCKILFGLTGFSHNLGIGKKKTVEKTTKKMSFYSAPPSFMANTIGSPKVLQILIMVFALSQATIAFILGPKVGHDLGPIQILTFFQPNLFREITSQWGMDEKMRFEKHFIVDYWFHPVLYSLGFISWVTRETYVAKRSPLPYFLFIAVPAVGGLCDIMENSIHYDIMRNGFVASDESIQLASFFSLMKWFCVVPTGFWCLFTYLARRKQKAD
jgi:hypothetical protein